MVAAVSIFGQNSKGGGRLVGTWDAVVTIRNCATGAPINTFASIASFNQGGTSIGSTSGIPQSLRTPEHGVWRHVSGNTYTFKFKSFGFDASGNAVSYAIVSHDLQLNEAADAYTSAGTARFYLLNGTQVGQGCSDAVGTRFDL
jgi:hypothetical protein